MALPASFLDELRARTSLAALVGRTVRLVRSGREQKGCCPFHNEKTPSFYVYDDRFHCFGCGAHGDAISFLTKSSGLSFIEAVEVLAQEAGITVPRASPQATEERARRADLSEIMSQANAVFTHRLFTPEGAEGLAYLRKRGLTDATIVRFGLGWSGEGRGQLAAALAREGITPAQMAEAGLMKQREDGSQAEFFFNRVMFPIRDRRGNIISFGGRVLGDGQP
ncbi:MAG TPA: CHC2 zinc finger domain-containing protein, partial [Acetobacteraceae bacterium]|nr:CHC2 zinc finger domain-containing protein [Acetobacteraceae bacterium]